MSAAQPGGLAVVTGASLFAVTGEAQATDTPPKFCSTLIGASIDGAPSPLLAEYCTDESRAAADAGLRAKKKALGLRHGADDDAQALVILWENANYTGTSNTVQGYDGVCDLSGYQFNDLSTYWQTHLSSVQGIATCDRLYVRKRSDFTQYKTFNLDAPSLNDGYNDNVGPRLQVYSSYHTG